MENIVTFIINHLEKVVVIAGGVGVGLFILMSKSGSNENDLTPIYIKYKRYADGIVKNTKSIF